MSSKASKLAESFVGKPTTWEEIIKAFNFTEIQAYHYDFIREGEIGFPKFKCIKYNRTILHTVDIDCTLPRCTNAKCFTINSEGILEKATHKMGECPHGKQI